MAYSKVAILIIIQFAVGYVQDYWINQNDSIDKGIQVFYFNQKVIMRFTEKCFHKLSERRWNRHEKS